MAHVSKVSQEEKRDANRTDRIDLTLYMATTPRESLPAGVANRWSANLMAPGSKEEADLRKLMENPSDPKNKFVLFFENRKEAMDYARALDSLLARSGVLSNVIITVSPTSAQDEQNYTLVPGQNYKISLAADKRERIAPLKGREEAILGKFRKAGESLQAVVPAKKAPADEDLFAQTRGALHSNDPLFGASENESELETIPKKAERGVAKVTPLPLKFKDSEGDTLVLIPNEKTRKEVEEARRDGTEYTFTLVGNSRLDTFLEAHGRERVEIKEIGNRKFEVTINKKTDWENKMIEMGIKKG